MSLLKQIISLAQDLDDLGLCKEADTLDRLSKALIKKSHDDSDDELSLELFAESFKELFQHHIMQGEDVEEATNKAVNEIERLKAEMGEGFEDVTERERERSSDLMMRHQLPMMYEKGQGSMDVDN
jgi:hypothetical protein